MREGFKHLESKKFYNDLVKWHFGIYFSPVKDSQVSLFIGQELASFQQSFNQEDRFARWTCKIFTPNGILVIFMLSDPTCSYHSVTVKSAVGSYPHSCDNHSFLLLGHFCYPHSSQDRRRTDKNCISFLSCHT